MKCARYCLIAILLSIVVLPLSALAANLQDLIDLRDQGASITAGDKLFTNFSGFLMSRVAAPTALGQIRVTGFSVGDTHGLSFSAQFDPARIPPPGFTAGPSGSLNLDVGFDGTVTAGHNTITGIAVGIPFALLSDSFLDLAAGGAAVGAFGNHDGSLSSGVVSLSSPTTSIHVEAGLSFGSFAVFDAFIEFPSYQISFVQRSVPEPSTALLLVFGGGVIAAIAHRVRRA